MNSRFKSFGFGKRKSAASIQTPEGLTPSPTPPPGQIPQQQLLHQQRFPSQQQPQQPQQPHHAPAPSIGASSSTTSLPMNHPGSGNRPPSYSANFPPGQAPVGRTSPHVNQNRTPPSQMVGGPPPINTGAPVGYPPNMNPMGQGPPPMGGPPGFGQQQQVQGYPPAGGPPPPQGPPLGQQFGRGNPAAEVEGASRSKAQLIVGIDFVSSRMSSLDHGVQSLTSDVVGNHLLRRRLCLRDQQRGQGRYHHRVARSWQLDQAKGASRQPQQI